MDQPYRLDKSAFVILTLQQAEDRHVDMDDALTPTERLNRCAYLTKVAYGYANQPWPKMEKGLFRVRRRRREEE